MSIRITYLHKMFSVYSGSSKVSHAHVRNHVYLESKDGGKTYKICVYDNIDIMAKYSYADKRFYEEWQPDKASKFYKLLDWMKANNK